MTFQALVAMEEMTHQTNKLETTKHTFLLKNNFVITKSSTHKIALLAEQIWHFVINCKIQLSTAAGKDSAASMCSQAL